MPTSIEPRIKLAGQTIATLSPSFRKSGILDIFFIANDQTKPSWLRRQQQLQAN
jgi:hypothetical protein